LVILLEQGSFAKSESSLFQLASAALPNGDPSEPITILVTGEGNGTCVEFVVRVRVPYPLLLIKFIDEALILTAAREIAEQYPVQDGE